MALITIGRYTLQTQLGSGGMATVYRGYDPRLARDVAVKLLLGDTYNDPNLRERFEREAHTIARLEHPAIVPVYDFGDDQGQLFLVMRLMTGGSLQDRLRRGPMSASDVAHIVSRLADALDTAHAMGVIHRDLKPGNILFDEYGHPMISDFGIAKLALDAGAATLTQTGSLVGTPAYMSPEQVRGDPDIDKRSDLYSFGIIVYEMLTGKPPYRADTPYGLLMQHVTAPIPRVLDTNPMLPLAVQAVIERALAKERSQRFASAGELATALVTALQQAPKPEPATAFEATLLPDALTSEPSPASAVPFIRPAEPVTKVPRRSLARPALIVAVIGLLGVALVGVAATGIAARWFLGRTATPAPTTAPATPSSSTAAAVTSTAPLAPTETQTPAPTSTATLAPLVQEPISLAGIVNGTLGNDYADPPTGRVQLGGVTFELDGQAFHSQAAPGPNQTFPTEAGVDLNLSNVSRVFVLITAGDGFVRWNGERVGQVVLTFADAEPVTVDLVLGQNLREWHPADNVVSTAPDVDEVWSGPIAGYPNLTGHLDMLTIDVPDDHATAVLTRIDFIDLSSDTVGSLDPAITVAGLAVEHR